MTYIKDRKGSNFTLPVPYHDVNILKLYQQGKTVEQVIKEIETSNFYDSNYVKNKLKNSLFELNRREQKLDIKTSDFISENYQKYRLFHTINHPSSVLLRFVANEILKLLNISSTKELSELFKTNEFLDAIYFPIYPSVASVLGLKFSPKTQYRFHNKTLNAKEAIEIFFKIYDENYSVVKWNKGIGIINDFIVETFASNNRNFVEQAYKKILKRKADRVGMIHYTINLKKGKMSRKMVCQRLINSKEFTQKNQ